MNEEPIQKESIFKKPWMQSITVIVSVFTLLAIFLVWQSKKDTVFVENAMLNAPIVNLSPVSAGTLNALYVKEGDIIPENTPVALVGSSIITAKEEGIIVSTPQALGGYFAPGATVVSVVSIRQMKVVGSVDETKGLKNIAEGQRATFTIDAFPGKEYEGILDEISPVSNDTGVLFSISDKRPIKKFDIKVRFNASQYPELKSGMSAKITVYTK